jgi:rubrerythrin
MLKDDQIKGLMLACELERGLAELYEAFAARLPELNGLWELLIKEERWHADAIRRLYQLTYEGKCAFDQGSVKCDAIQSIVDYIRETTAAARQGRFTALRAAAVVCDLEKSLIERDIFAHFKVSPAYADILRLLQEGTRKHIELAQGALDALKAGGATTAP